MKVTIVHTTGPQMNDFRLDVIEVPGMFTEQVKSLAPARNRHYRKRSRTWEVDTNPYGNEIISEIGRLGHSVEIREERV